MDRTGEVTAVKEQLHESQQRLLTNINRTPFGKAELTAKRYTRNL